MKVKKGHPRFIIVCILFSSRKAELKVALYPDFVTLMIYYFRFVYFTVFRGYYLH